MECFISSTYASLMRLSSSRISRSTRTNLKSTSCVLYMPSMIEAILMYSARFFGSTNGNRLIVRFAISIRLCTSISSGLRPCMALTVISTPLSTTSLFVSGTSMPRSLIALTVRGGSFSTRARYRRTSLILVSSSSLPTIP